MSPELKLISLEDRNQIETFTSQFNPQSSNFGFSSLYTWNTDDQTTFGFDNDNLVIRRKDYVSDKQIYSVLGTNNVLDTITPLLEENIELKLVPQIVIDHIQESAGMEITEDPDNHDYLLSLGEISSLQGKKWADKRYQVGRAQRLYPDANITRLNLQQDDTQIQIMKLFDTWVTQKQQNLPKDDEVNERIAIKKLFELSKETEIIALGLFVQGILAGFFSNDVQNSSYTTGLFVKGNRDFKDVYDLLYYQSFSYLFARGFQLYNFEMDLGLPGLKYAKHSWRPIDFIKHYKIKKIKP